MTKAEVETWMDRLDRQADEAERALKETRRIGPDKPQSPMLAKIEIRLQPYERIIDRVRDVVVSIIATIIFLGLLGWAIEKYFTS